MSRDAGGTYSLPAGNPVVTATTITSSWANTTLADLETEMSDSLSRSGKGSMSGVLKLADGTEAAPGIAFNADTNTGLFRVGSDSLGVTAGGTKRLHVNSSLIYTTIPLTFDSDTTLQTQLGHLESDAVIQNKSSDYTPVYDDRSTLLNCTATMTLNLTAAATLGDGWFIGVKANGADITIDPNGSETVDGSATSSFVDGEAGFLYCDGSNFLTVKGAAAATTGGTFKGENGEKNAANAGDIFRVHEQELNTSVTIDADENGVAVGPLTIASGVTITITSGGNLSIV